MCDSRSSPCNADAIALIGQGNEMCIEPRVTYHEYDGDSAKCQRGRQPTTFTHAIIKGNAMTGCGATMRANMNGAVTNRVAATVP